MSSNLLQMLYIYLVKTSWLMKKLYLVRHAKAELPNWDKRDYDRNLIERGIERAQHIATALKQIITVNEKTAVISSSANRAIQTAQLFCEILDYPLEQIIQNKNIYEAHYLEILKAINVVNNTNDNLVVFGHNPGLSDLTNYICNSGIDLKTAHVAVISLEEGIDFSSLSGGTATLLQIVQE